MKYIKRIAVVLGLFWLGSAPLFAFPTLQLNIKGGAYNSQSATVIAPTTTNVFKLYAYLIEDLHSSDLVTDTYFLSMAVSPNPNSSNLGSVIFNGTPISVTSGMVYGTPPVETNLAHDPNDLSTHSIFPTYFSEFSFSFNSANKTQGFDTQTSPGLDPTLSPYVNGSPMYYQGFTIDVSNLDPAYVVHFDLYSKLTVMGTTYTTGDFPSAYKPASSQTCTNGSTSYPHCTLTIPTPTDHPSSYVAAHYTCPGGYTLNGTMCDKRNKPSVGATLVPQSCTNGSTSFPNCTTTSTTSTNYNSAYVAARPQYCTNGSTIYPLCTKTITGVGPNGDIDVKSFAPYSHDAEGGYHNVPEPQSILLLGCGLIGLALARKRMGRSNG